MKISLNWIGDYVDLTGVDKKELISKIGLATAEIEEVEEKGKGLDTVVVAKILEVENHPNSKKLHLLKVDNGSEILNIVCGAPNVREGMKIALAQIGTKMSEDFVIEKATIAGYESFGMCCSEKELGLSDNNDGILEITDDFALGTPLTKIYPIEDTVFEIDNKSLTNRPDLWCHYGMAREIACILNRPLKPLKLADLGRSDFKRPLEISVEDKNCYRYTGLKISGVTRHESPLSMKIRLYYCGMRAINFLADLTNYVMLDIGQPMHAFDGDFVKSITVKSFDTDLEFTTLDGEKRNVPAGSTMIVNENEPVAIAGVMGGLNSEINPQSTSLVLESACFDAMSTRKTAQSLGLRTEASNRYEKSLDPENTIVAIKRVVELLQNYNSGITFESSVTDVYKHKYDIKPIEISMEYINSQCGFKLDRMFVQNTLKALEFKVQDYGTTLMVTPPSFRATKDVSIKADIVEEVARMYGYDNIVPTPVISEINPVEQSKEHNLEYETKLTLAENFGLNEVHTYVWNYADFNKEYGIETTPVAKIVNSTDPSANAIRQELVPTLIKIATENKNTDKEIGIFEIGRCVTGIDDNNNYIEDKHLAIVLTSEKEEAELYFNLKQMLDTVCENLLHVKPNFKLSVNLNKNFISPKNNAQIILNNEVVGYMATVNPRLRRNIDKKLNIVMLEIDFRKFAQTQEQAKTSKQLTKYQTNNLDFNFVASKNKVYGEIEEYLKGFKTDLTFELSLVDIYEDEVNLKDKRSYTFRANVYSFDHTLTSQELEAFHKDFIAYAFNFGLTLR